MQSAKRDVFGYTLVEVLVVVSIIGILSSMGVVGLQRAVANARIKDAAINTAAFVERVANEANRRSAILCLKVDPTNHHRVLAVLDNTTKDCSNPTGGSIDELTIDSPSEFKAMSACGPVTTDWFSAYGVFKSKTGLSAMPTEGGVCIQYGSKDIYGAVRKESSKNWATPMWKTGSDGTQNATWNNWSEL